MTTSIFPIRRAFYESIASIRDTTRDADGPNLQTVDLRQSFSQKSKETLAGILNIDFPVVPVTPYEDSSFLRMRCSEGVATYSYDDILFDDHSNLSREDIENLVEDLKYILVTVTSTCKSMHVLKLILQQYPLGPEEVHIDVGSPVATASLSDEEGHGTIFVGRTENSPDVDIGISTPLSQLTRSGEFEVIRAKPWEFNLLNQRDSIWPVAHAVPCFKLPQKGRGRLLLLMN